MPVVISVDLIEIAPFQNFWWKACGNGFMVLPVARARSSGAVFDMSGFWLAHSWR